MGKNASARVKTRIKNKFVRAIRRAEAQELSREQYFRDRKKNSEAQAPRN
jgi:fructose-1,6-bisphosphatase